MRRGWGGWVGRAAHPPNAGPTTPGRGPTRRGGYTEQCPPQAGLATGGARRRGHNLGIVGKLARIVRSPRRQSRLRRGTSRSQPPRRVGPLPGVVGRPAALDRRGRTHSPPIRVKERPYGQALRRRSHGGLDGTDPRQASTAAAASAWQRASKHRRQRRRLRDGVPACFDGSGGVCVAASLRRAWWLWRESAIL